MADRVGDSRARHAEDPVDRSGPESPHGREPGPFSVARLWAGGAATALVAGLVSLTGLLTARDLFDAVVLAPKGPDAWGQAEVVTHALVAAACAFAATGLLEVLLPTTPDAVRSFTWIALLVAGLAAVLPLEPALPLGDRVATAVVNGAIGVAITACLRDVARRSRG